MVFVITIFKNFDEKFYKNSGSNSKIKCEPYFPSKSICWRKQKGAFKLDTSVKINEANVDKHTYKMMDSKLDKVKFKEFVNSIIKIK